jgi:hypothetical protein
VSDKPTRDEILRRNPQVHEERVAEYLEFERRMKAQGFDLIPRYQVARPLGRPEAARDSIQSADHQRQLVGRSLA